MSHRHRSRIRWSLIGLVAGVLTGFVVIGAAWAQVPNVTIGTNPAGTVFYAVGSGIAKVASESGKVKMAIQPYSGSSTFIPLLNTGEIDFGMVNAVDMALAYRGPSFKVGGRNPFPYAPNLRLVMRGSPLMVGLLVRKDSPIKTIGDVKGKRLTGEYPAQLAVWYNMFGHLASASLTWSDVKVVPVPAVNDGVDALLQGRADVSQHALNSAKVREADSTVGVRHLSNDCSPEGARRVRAAVPAAVPGYYSQVVKAAGAAAVIEDGCFIAYDIYFGAGEKTSEAAVEATLRAIWENVEKLAPIHPVLREWTRDKAVDPNVTIPYHPGAIRFYKERGVWKPDMDQVQQKLLATKP